MTHPTDDELEAMAEMLEHCQLWNSDRSRAAAMLRACKPGDAPSYLDGWNDAREAAAQKAERYTECCQSCAGVGHEIRALTPPERTKL
jgi:hypothetical protein